MEAREVMTRDVVTVGPGTTVGEIAAILVRHRISAVPVVSDAQVLGIVSQTDLAHRSETGTEKRRKWWLELFADPDAKAREYVRSHGLRAEDVMTRLVVSVRESASLACRTSRPPIQQRHRFLVTRLRLTSTSLANVRYTVCSIAPLRKKAASG